MLLVPSRSSASLGGLLFQAPVYRSSQEWDARQGSRTKHGNDAWREQSPGEQQTCSTVSQNLRPHPAPSPTAPRKKWVEGNFNPFNYLHRKEVQVLDGQEENRMGRREKMLLEEKLQNTQSHRSSSKRRGEKLRKQNMARIRTDTTKRALAQKENVS